MRSKDPELSLCMGEKSLQYQIKEMQKTLGPASLGCCPVPTATSAKASPISKCLSILNFSTNVHVWGMGVGRNSEEVTWRSSLNYY